MKVELAVDGAGVEDKHTCNVTMIVYVSMRSEEIKQLGNDWFDRLGISIAQVKAEESFIFVSLQKAFLFFSPACVACM